MTIGASALAATTLLFGAACSSDGRAGNAHPAGAGGFTPANGGAGAATAGGSSGTSGGSGGAGSGAGQSGSLGGALSAGSGAGGASGGSANPSGGAGGSANPSGGVLGACEGGSCDCRLANRVELAPAGARAEGTQVYRTPAGFVLTGLPQFGSSVPPFVLASWSGLDSLTYFDTTNFGLLLGAVPIFDGNRELLLIVDRGPGQDGTFGMRATTWGLNDQNPISQSVFLNAAYYGQVVTMGTGRSRDGKRVLFVYGNRIVDVGPTLTEFGPDGSAVAEPRTLTLQSKTWASLQLVPTARGGALSALAQSEDRQQTYWNLAEIDETSAITFQTAALLEGMTGDSYLSAPRIVRSGGAYIARFGTSITGQQFKRVRRTAAVNAPAEVWEPNASVESGLLDFAAVDSDFLFVRKEGDQLVAQRVDAAGEPFAAALPFGDASTLDTIFPLTIFAVDNSNIYVDYATSEARVLAEIDCPPRH